MINCLSNCSLARILDYINTYTYKFLRINNVKAKM